MFQRCILTDAQLSEEDCVSIGENLCVNLRSMYVYHVCLHLLSGDIDVLHSYKV